MRSTVPDELGSTPSAGQLLGEQALALDKVRDLR